MWNLPDLFFVPFDTGAILRRASLPVGAQPELEAITLEEAEGDAQRTGEAVLQYSRISSWLIG